MPQKNTNLLLRELCNSKSVFHTPWLYRKKAKYISNHFLKRMRSPRQKATSPKTVTIQVYAGKNIFVTKMSTFLQRELHNDLRGAYVHGSLGTYEETNFSDFDALVIIKDEVLTSPIRLANVAAKLHKAQTIMLELDPLQHHGWFILTETDLEHYPEHYFPHELFKYAKSLLTNCDTKLTINLPDTVEYSELFLTLAVGIHNRLRNGNFPRNMYDLKSLLSQFMLLPSLYIQLRDKKGIYKKKSFAEARKDFSPEVWSIMEEVSTIRKNWHYSINSIQKYIMTNPDFCARKLSKYIAPGIPDDILQVLTPHFYDRMADFSNILFTRQQHTK